MNMNSSLLSAMMEASHNFSKYTQGFYFLFRKLMEKMDPRREQNRVKYDRVKVVMSSVCFLCSGLILSGFAGEKPFSHQLSFAAIFSF